MIKSRRTKVLLGTGVLVVVVLVIATVVLLVSGGSGSSTSANNSNKDGSSVLDESWTNLPAPSSVPTTTTTHLDDLVSRPAQEPLVEPTTPATTTIGRATSARPTTSVPIHPLHLPTSLSGYSNTPPASTTTAGHTPTVLPTTRQPSLKPLVGTSLEPSFGPLSGPSREPSIQPTLGPSPLPTRLPTPGPTNLATRPPTPRPTLVATATPTPWPSPRPTPGPTPRPTPEPTPRPTPEPTQPPLPLPTRSPTSPPTPLPTRPPSLVPSRLPSLVPISPHPTTRFGANATFIFYAIADAPYNARQQQELPEQVRNLPRDGELLVHLGDIRSAAEGKSCVRSEYQLLANILKESSAPALAVMGGACVVQLSTTHDLRPCLTHCICSCCCCLLLLSLLLLSFVDCIQLLLVDNEWNDCPNMDGGWRLWMEELMGLESSWPLLWRMHRPPERPETFSFVRKGVLVVGLNLVGGRVHDAGEWRDRLMNQAVWVQHLLQQHKGDYGAVVLLGHANPTRHHEGFFHPVRDYLLQHPTVRVLYVNGDAHLWRVDWGGFYGVPNFYRIQLTGGTSEPPLRIAVHPRDPIHPFSYDRRL